jgi:hypothetical protein
MSWNNKAKSGEQVMELASMWKGWVFVDTHHESEYAKMRIMLMGNRRCHALTLQRRQIETSSRQYWNMQLWSCYRCAKFAITGK